ncbi:Kynurenine 3-monooxygenase [Streptomyces badius]
MAAAGLRGLTHRAVDTAAGLPVGSTSYYFRTRSALISACYLRLATLTVTDVDALEERHGVPDPDSAAEALAALLHRWLTTEFGAWHDPIPALLERLDRREPGPVTVLHHDFHELAEPLPRFHSGRVALLGDAAHAMTPNLGQGGCQAIEDAVVLAHLLARGTGVPAALAAYTEARHGRTTRISRRSRRMGDLARLSHPLAVSVRNFAVRATPSAVTTRGLDTLLGWQPPPGPAPSGPTSPGPVPGSARAARRSVGIEEEQQW